MRRARRVRACPLCVQDALGSEGPRGYPKHVRSQREPSQRLEGSPAARTLSRMPARLRHVWRVRRSTSWDAVLRSEFGLDLFPRTRLTRGDIIQPLLDV